MMSNRILNARNICLINRCLVSFKCIRNQTLSAVLVRNKRFQFCHLRYRLIHITHISNKVVAFNLSDIGEGIREVVIKEWFVKVGDKVNQFDNICEVQSDKAAVTITSRYDGTVTKLYHEVEQTALVGHPLVDIEVADEAIDSETENREPITNLIKEDIKQKAKVLTTPAVRRIAAQFNVDLSTVKATGRNERILKEDLLTHLNISAEKSNQVPESINPISFEKSEQPLMILEDKIVPITGFTKAMFRSMNESLSIPHFVYSDEYNVSKLVKWREDIKRASEERGVKVTYMPIIIKAASLSLSSYPIINSTIDSVQENLIFKSSHNIGIAMNTFKGLVVPVIKNVQTKNIFQLAKELNLLQDKGVKGLLDINDLTGGTFTLSNIGIVGGTYTKPVISPPQVSIGAFGRIQVLPRYDEEGNVVPTHMLSVSWAADHRVIDGVTMASFSNKLKQYLENPNLLLLDM